MSLILKMTSQYTLCTEETWSPVPMEELDGLQCVDVGKGGNKDLGLLSDPISTILCRARLGLRVVPTPQLTFHLATPFLDFGEALTVNIICKKDVNHQGTTQINLYLATLSLGLGLSTDVLSSGPWHFLLRKRFSLLCRKSPCLCLYQEQAGLHSASLKTERLQIYLCSFPTSPGSTLQSLSTKSRHITCDQPPGAWELLSRGRAVCPREGKSQFGTLGNNHSLEK